MTHCPVDTVVCRSRAMASRPTLTMVVSSRAAIAPTIKIAVSLIRAGSSRSGACVGAGAAA